MLSHANTRPGTRCGHARKPRGLLSALLGFDQNFRNRRQLDRLDAHLRRDVGLDEPAARTELDRPFWDIPTWWR